MKKFLFLTLFIVSAAFAFAVTKFSSYKGVWANNNAEAVVTDSVCIFYESADSTMQAVIEIPVADILHKTVFAPDGSVSFPLDVTPLDISESDGCLVINGQSLKRVENVELVSPYEMSVCKTNLDVGKCLQEWRLGCAYGMQDGMPYCEINTNRHMFVYLVSPSMVYIRAAAARNNNNGTLFFQNIRMMKNQGSGEYTMRIYPNNYNIARDDLRIDNSKFQPDGCTFNPDGGIYWSLISFTDTEIRINGCGETYVVPRPTVGWNLKEWIKYVPYSNSRELPEF